MTFKRYIAEEYKDSFKQGNYTVEVFKNPSKSEFDKLRKENTEIRGIIFANGDLWIWNSLKAAHAEVAHHMGVSKGKNITISIYTFRSPFWTEVSGYSMDSLSTYDQYKERAKYNFLVKTNANLKRILGSVELRESVNETYIDPQLTQELIQAVARNFGWSVTQAGLALIALAGGSLASLMAIFHAGGLSGIIELIKKKHGEDGF